MTILPSPTLPKTPKILQGLNLPKTPKKLDFWEIESPSKENRKSVGKIGGAIIDIVDFGTDLPNKARKLADDYTDLIIDRADQIKKLATGKAEENLTKSKVSSLADNAGQWVANNLPIAGVVLAVVLFLIFRK